MYKQKSKKSARERQLDRFGRSAVFEAFPYRHARAIDYDKFQDRKPSEKPWEPPSGIDGLFVLAE